MKNSYQAIILLEVILSIIITAIIVINAMIIFKEFHTLSKEEFYKEIWKLELRNTQYFLEKNIQTISDISKIEYINQELFYNNHRLLQNVSTYSFYKSKNQNIIKICIANNLCEEFILL